EIEPGSFAARMDGRELSLTAHEFKLLLELARRPAQVFTRELLLQRVWNYEYLGDSRLVDVAIQRVRSKVEPDPAQTTLIRTARGGGRGPDPFEPLGRPCHPGRSADPGRSRAARLPPRRFRRHPVSHDGVAHPGLDG